MIKYMVKHIRSILMIGIVSQLILILFLSYTLHTTLLQQQKVVSSLNQKNTQIASSLQKTQSSLVALQNVDQVKKNDALQKEVKDIETTYSKSVVLYEDLVKLKEQTDKTSELDKLFALSVTQLSKHNFGSAEATLASLSASIQKTKADIAATFTIPKNIPVNNTAPQSGSQNQQVQTDVGTFLVNVIAADLNSTRVIVDTASDSDCRDNCPVLPLGTYAARSGAFAGINGPYFCPESYPSCAGKTNSFDTLLMNKNKHYFNSDNNVYSAVPAVIFSGNSARFVGQSSQWGRDTGVDSVIANQPLLVSNGNVVFGGDDEAKRAGQGTRAFIGATGNTVYIGVVYNANVAQVARVLKTMGIQNALNLDSGGSIALWNNGRYLAGPGRNTPFGILFVRK
jgi:exopolysaccharide biosynthesis protein